MSELKPCPWCGCVYEKDDGDFYYMGIHKEWCPLDGKAILVADTKKAIKDWNRRAS